MCKKRVLIACCDEMVKKLVSKSLEKTSCKGLEIEVCTTHADLFSKLRETDEPIVIFDKYFFGYVICYKLLQLRVINSKAVLCFCEYGDCSRYFGLRLYDLGVKAFITNIEDSEHLKEELNKIASGHKSLPHEIEQSIADNDYLLDRKCFTEVTEKEMEIGLYLGYGKSQKEISYITGMSPKTVNTHVHRLKRKIGYKKPSDYSMLNRVALLVGNGGPEW